MDTIRKQYADEIHSAYLECEHEDGRQVDYTRLNQQLRKLMGHAKAEGLSVKEFEDLVKSTLPDVWDKVDLSQGGSRKNAA